MKVGNRDSARNLVFTTAAGTLILAFLVLVPFPVQAVNALDGNMYVSSPDTNEVKRYNANTGAFIDNFVSAGSGGLAVPREMTFGPDGNLYVTSPGNNEIKRYNGTTGAFIDNFVILGNGQQLDSRVMAFGPDGNLYAGTDGDVKRFGGNTGTLIDTFVPRHSVGLTSPISLTFGPDGNLYIINPAFESSHAPLQVDRYDGTTGAFIDNFVSAFASGVSYPLLLTFGQDGNLYNAGATFANPDASGEVSRYNGTTGAFIDNFVPGGTGGLRIPSTMAFGPDGNLYIGSYFTHDIKRYNGATGAFIDNFVTVPISFTAQDVVGDIAFAVLPQEPPAPQNHTLTVNAVDLSGNAVNGVWTVIRTASDGSIIKTGFTPVTFTGDSAIQYKVSVANYDGKLFKRWEDAGTNNVRTITLTKDTMITATYDTGDSLRGFTSLTYTGTAEQPDLTVNAVAIGTNKLLHMWTVIDPQSSDASNTTYKVYAGNYRDLVFDHWNDGNKDRVRTLTISSATTITAYYRTEPQNLKVEFAYKDCGLSSAGCGVGTITCADGTTEGPGPISLAFGFTVSKTSGNPVDGIWRAAIPGAAGPSGASGALTTLSFDGAANSIKTEGDLSSGSICNGDPLPSATNNINVTFSGICGGTEVRYEATNGTKATIQGDITCTTS